MYQRDSSRDTSNTLPVSQPSKDIYQGTERRLILCDFSRQQKHRLQFQNRSAAKKDENLYASTTDQIRCHGSYLENAIINSGQRGPRGCRHLRLPPEYFHKNPEGIRAKESYHRSGSLTMNEFFRRFCSLVVSNRKEFRDGWIEWCGVKKMLE